MSPTRILRNDRCIDDSSQMDSTVLVANADETLQQNVSTGEIKSDIDQWSQSKKERMAVTPRRISSSLDQLKLNGQKGDQLFRESIKSCGATDEAIKNTITQFQQSWRRYRQTLGLISSFLASQLITSTQLKNLQFPHFTILNLIGWLRNRKSSHATILRCKRAISILLIANGHPENKIYNKITANAVKIDRRKTAKPVKENMTYNIDIVLNHIQQQFTHVDQLTEIEIESITLTVIMASTARRLAEIVRATLDLDSIKTDTINLNTEVLKVG
ncbi:MAG: hypothetical protein EZS28_019887, partial [Streblomastix strix]